MRDLEPLEAAYIAGIVDGEGNISYACTLRERQNNLQYQLQVAISNTDMMLINYLYGKCQSGRIGLYRSTRGKEKPVYRIYWAGDAALEFLAQIEPYLVIKKERALIVLAFYAKVIETFGTVNLRGMKVIPEWLKSERVLVHEKMRELNKRGV